MAARSTAKLGAASPLVALVALALALAGCGSASPATRTTGAAGPSRSPTEQHFIARAALICASASQRERPLKARKEALRSSASATAAPAFASLVRQASAIARGADESLAALPRPAADAQAIGQLVHAYSLEATDAGEIANGVANKDSELGEAASDALAGIVRKNLSAAKSLGMGACFTLE
jgi:hypothetical protein